MDIKSRVKIGKDGSADWGGASQPTPGTYLGRYNEGIELKNGGEDGTDTTKRRINIPITVIEGENNGKIFYASIFVDGEDWMKERSFDQLCVIIEIAGLTTYFMGKYAKYDSLLDDAIIENVVRDLQVKLVDKIARFTTELQKSKDGDKEYLRIRKVAPASSGGSATARNGTSATTTDTSPDMWEK